MLRLIKDTRLWNGQPFRGKPPATADNIGDLFVWLTLGVIIGGRLGYVLLYGTLYCGLAGQGVQACTGLPQAFIANPIKIIAAWEGGMSFHGGLIGVVLAIWLFCRRQKLNLLAVADLVAAATPIGLTFGRIANFINGELWGKITNVPWAVVFPNASPLRAAPSEPDLRSLVGGRAPFHHPAGPDGALADPSPARAGGGVVSDALRAVPFPRRVRARLRIENLWLVQHGSGVEPADVGGRGVLLLVCAASAGAGRARCAGQDGQTREVNALKEKLIGLILSKGPITLAEYMRIALGDPEHGFYVTRDPFGAAGDFITAPEVSQIFGELIGLFFVQAWEDRGSPEKFHLVELGPGRGTLMADILRAAKLRPAFLAAARVTLIETSRALRAVQERTLAGAGATWAESLDALPDGEPLFLVANEFFDALPAHQFVKSERGWHQRMVGAEGDDLVFALSPNTLPPEIVPPMLRDATVGAVVEIAAEAIGIARNIAARIARSGGVALFIDYGSEQSGLGDTFQAVKAHRYADPLAAPGSADLTFQVDFAQLGRAAMKEEVFGFRPDAARGHFSSCLA